jgi:TolB-like protein
LPPTWPGTRAPDGADEEGTHERLKAHLRDLIEPKIAEHRGRIVKTAGDGFLAEFASVVDAVRCAVKVQRGMPDRNAATPPEERIEFRVGINLGDVIAEGEDIFGDGVNIAARLEALAEPGGIYVSRVVRDQVRDKLDYTFEDLGEQQVKNIARPVRGYRVRDTPIPTDAPTPASRQPLVLPDKPSIAVLPFANMSGDPEQEYFADGMVEEIITALSRMHWLFVIARNSTFTYKGHAVDVKRVGRELGVRYVLEGSVRKAGQRVRITAQRSWNGFGRCICSIGCICVRLRCIDVSYNYAQLCAFPAVAGSFQTRCWREMDSNHRSSRGSRFILRR